VIFLHTVGTSRFNVKQGGTVAVAEVNWSAHCCVFTEDETAHAAAVTAGRRDSSAAIGIISAVGAFGGFFINRGFGTSIAATGGAGAALFAFACFYAACAALTWFCYLRTVGVRFAPSLAGARV
jgi:NNP family nitrate/nitrite transporter-like MFS transporter